MQDRKTELELPAGHRAELQLVNSRSSARSPIRQRWSTSTRIEGGCRPSRTVRVKRPAARVNGGSPNHQAAGCDRRRPAADAGMASDRAPALKDELLGAGQGFCWFFAALS